jgi:mRNA interferase MazF
MKKRPLNVKSGKGATLSSIKRGEIWLVNLDPTIGAEIRKTRPVIVLSSDALGKLPVKLVAPLTSWKAYLAQNVWHVKIAPDKTNGLSKPSSVDTLQLRGVDTQRFIHKIGDVSAEIMESITAAIVILIEHEF